MPSFGQNQTAALRLATATRPNRAEPKSQAAAGRGTAEMDRETPPRLSVMISSYRKNFTVSPAAKVKFVVYARAFANEPAAV